MYKSPIEIVQTGMRVQMENGIMKAVQDVGIRVDKAELLKSLAYDREQYKKGYADGREAGNEWISVEDSLPDKHRCVLVHLRCGTIMIGVHNGRNWWDDLAIVNNDNVTHWMPLPEPPEEA
jgi:hypothetical protein